MSYVYDTLLLINKRVTSRTRHSLKVLRTIIWCANIFGLNLIAKSNSFVLI